MLTGSRAFAGDSVAKVYANVIKTEPDWTALPADTPAALRLCLQRCLQKDLRQRFHDIADARLAMEGAFEQPTRDSDATQHGGTSRSPLAYAGWAIALVAIAGALAIVASGPDAPAEVAEARLEIVTPPAVDPLSLAISPDGRSVVFQAEQDPPRLWLRPLASQEARALMGTEGAPRLSGRPTAGRSGFLHQVLKRIDLENGFVRTVAPVISPRGAAWHRNGTILIGNGLGPLNSVPAGGGTMKPATQLLPRRAINVTRSFCRRRPLPAVRHRGARGPWTDLDRSAIRAFAGSQIGNWPSRSRRPATSCSHATAHYGHGD